MIPNKYNSIVFGDLPFSIARLSNYDIPYFANQVPYGQIIPYVSASISGSQSVPLWFNTSNKATVLFKMSMAGAEPTCKIYDEITLASVTVGLTNFKTVVSSGLTWKYYYGIIDLVGFGSEYVNSTYELRIIKDSNIIAKCPLRPFCIDDVEKTLNFNFWNFNGNVAGFPFKDFSTNDKESLGYGGLTYMIEGGINVGNNKNAIDQTSFRDQRFNSRVLSANPRKLATLTIGGSKGVPEYVGEEINNILCCDTVFVNGMQVTRSGDSVPEPSVIAKGYPFVNFTVDVEIIKTEPHVYNVINFLGL